MGKLKIIIIVFGIIVVGTIGTVAIISNNISSKTQNQILTTASTNESVTKNETETENKTSANSAASNNNTNESSSNQNQESTNQVAATNTTSNTSNSTSSNTSTSINTSATNVNSNKNLEHDFTFYPATINKNCSLYDAPPNFGGGVSSKLPKGQTVFVNPTSTAQKGWSLTRLPVGAGYLPNSSFTENANTKYLLERVNIPTKLYSKPSKNSTTINLNPQIFKDSYIPNATLVFVQQESNLPNGWSSVFVGVSGTQFKQGYIPTNMLSIY